MTTPDQLRAAYLTAKARGTKAWAAYREANEAERLALNAWAASLTEIKPGETVERVKERGVPVEHRGRQPTLCMRFASVWRLEATKSAIGLTMPVTRLTYPATSLPLQSKKMPPEMIVRNSRNANHWPLDSVFWLRSRCLDSRLCLCSA